MKIYILINVTKLNMQIQAGNSNFHIYITQCILKYEITVISSFRKMYTNFLGRFILDCKLQFYYSKIAKFSNSCISSTSFKLTVLK